MAIEKVRAYFAQFGMEDRILEFQVSSATVELAAIAVGVEGKRIAKTLSFLVGEQPILVAVACGLIGAVLLSVMLPLMQIMTAIG